MTIDTWVEQELLKLKEAHPGREVSSWEMHTIFTMWKYLCDMGFHKIDVEPVELV